MTISASMRVGQRPLRLICVFSPSSCLTQGGPGPFTGQPSNLDLLILDRVARALEGLLGVGRVFVRYPILGFHDRRG